MDQHLGDAVALPVPCGWMRLGGEKGWGIGMGRGMGSSCRRMAAGFPLAFIFPFFFLFFLFPSVLFNQNFKLDSKQLFINLSGEAGISLSGCY